MFIFLLIEHSTSRNVLSSTRRQGTHSRPSHPLSEGLNVIVLRSAILLLYSSLFKIDYYYTDL
jgi:hypothetical protein